MQRSPLFLALLLLVFASCSGPDATASTGAFNVVEATIPEMQQAMEEGRLTSKALVTAYLVRLATYENLLNAAVAVNPNALAEAEALDRERAEGRVRGPLHGIPIALKDNIHTTDMPTTGGALAFAGFVPPYEATLTTNLRSAGAIIIAKTVMTELANGMAGGATPMPGNYSAVGGYAFNPYDPRRDPRAATEDGRPVLSPGGSSSGVGTTANLWAANVGTETSGSVLGASNAVMLVGIKPTVGRISRWGVIPLNGDQDTAGPMTRTVTDAAILLGVMEGASPDPNDPATEMCTPPANRDYSAFLDAGALRGARIGIPRAFYYDSIKAPGEDSLRGGLRADQQRLMTEAIEVLRQQGAILVDPADIPSVVNPNASDNFLLWGGCGAVRRPSGCTVPYAMKRDFNAWLATLGPTAPVKTLTELREWNVAHQKAGAMKYNQQSLDNNDRADVPGDSARHEVDLARTLELAATHGIDEVMTANTLDALLFPGASGAAISARARYPTVVVPFGRVPNEPTQPLPEGFGAEPGTMGVSFAGSACSEPRLIALAYAFEQATKRRVPPPTTP